MAFKSSIVKNKTVDVIILYRKLFLWGGPGKIHKLHTQTIIGVIGRKSDNRIILILSDTNTYSFQFMYSDSFENSDWDGIFRFLNNIAFHIEN